VPHPPRGYWARRAAGAKMLVSPLPAGGPGDPISWVKGIAVMERLPPLELPPEPTLIDLGRFTSLALHSQYLWRPRTCSCASSWRRTWSAR